MGDENAGEVIQAQRVNQVQLVGIERRSDIEFVDDKFQISKTVNKIHQMVEDITSKELNARNVNAACNCINQLNTTINTTILAARFLREKV